MKSDTIRRYKNLVFVLIVFSVMLPFFSLLSNAAEADGWYWSDDDKILYVKDGEITKRQLYKAIAELHGSTPKAVKYNPQKAPSGWDYGGTTLTSASTAKEELSNGTYVAACRTKDTFAKGREEYEFTVIVYYDLSISVTSGAPDGAGASLSATKVLSGESVMITVNEVAGYKAEIMDMSGAPISDTNAYKPSASGELTVTYSILPKYDVTVNTANSEYGTVTLKSESEGVSGAKVLYEIKPLEKTATVDYFIESVSAGGVPLVQDENGYYVYTVGDGDAVVEVSFGKRELLCNSDPTATVHSGMSFEEIQKALFNAVIADSLRAEITENKISFFYYPRKKAAGNLSEESPIAINTPAGADEYSFAEGSGPYITERIRIEWDGLYYETNIVLFDPRPIAGINASDMKFEGKTAPADIMAKILSRLSATLTDPSNSASTSIILSEENLSWDKPFAWPDPGESAVFTVTVNLDGEYAGQNSKSFTLTCQNTTPSYRITFRSENKIYYEYFAFEGDPLVLPSDPERENYEFAGWDPAVSGIVTDIATYKATWIPETDKNGNGIADQEESFTVYWDLDCDGKADDHAVVKYGEMPAYSGAEPKKTDPSGEYSFTFVGWDKNIEAVTENITYTAVFSSSKKSYTVTWINGDTLLKTETLEYGSMPSYDGETPTKIDPNGKYTYTFSGWSPEIKAVTGNITYSAQFKSNVNQYTVTWKNYDGAILKTEKIDHGTVPYYTGATPDKVKDAQYTYTFNGWDTIPTEVTSDIEFIAQFRKTVNKYTVYWDYDGDGKAEDSFVLEYGVLPSHFAPNKNSDTQYDYTFLGWSPEIKHVSENITYTAVFGENVRKYTVSWINGNTVLKTETLEYGSVPSYDGETPTKIDSNGKYTYTFSGWSPEIKAVTGNITYSAQFKSNVNQYTVTWKNYDGSILKTEKIDHGTVPYYTGATPVKVKDAQYTYTFNGWDKVPDEVTSDIEFTAQFRKTVNKYTIYWDYDGDGKAEDSFVLEYGVLPSHFAPSKTSDTQYDYTFLGWVPEIVPVSENVTYTAVFGENVRKYTVSWINGNTVLKTETLEYASMPSYDGETPTKIDPSGKYTYTFSGWSPEIKSVIGDITYSAQFKSNVNQYTVTWKNYDGSILKTEKVDHGTVPYYTGATPDKSNDAQYTYTFNGWDTIPKEATSDIEFTAQFRKTVNKYTVYWDYDGDGKAEDSFILEYGTLPSHFAPNKTSNTQYDYTFLGWSPEIKPVSENITYTAVFGENIRKYTVSWVNGTEVLQSEELPYGSMPEYRGEAPTKIDPNGKYTYTFSVWSPEIKAVTGNITYSAQFKSNVNQYTVTWKNYDGNILKTEKIDHGTVPYYTGATPVKVKDAQYTYTFNGWNVVPSELTSDVEYTAQFRKTVNKYTVYWDYDGDGKAEDSFILEYGTLPSHFAPGKTSDTQYDYTFLGWAPEIKPVSENITYTAVFGESVRKYTVSWVNGTEVLQSEELPYGSMPEYRGEIPTKIDPSGKYTYTFSGWSPEIKAVTGNITYSAQFKSNVNQYTVTWKNYDGSILKTEKVDHGTVPYYTGTTPSKPKDKQYTYTFNGWNVVPSEVTSDVEYTAQFRKTVNKYTVYWDYDGDGKAEDSFVLEYGVLPSHFAPNKTSDTQYDYTFLGWSPEIKPVSENITYTAVFGEKVRNYTVSWTDGSKVLLSKTYEYGEMPVYDAAVPVKAIDAKYTYSFAGWSPEISPVRGNIVYTAVFSKTLNADSGRIFIDGGAEEFDTKKLIGLKNKVVSASGLPLPGNYSVLMVVDDLFGETEHINIETGIEFDALILACRLTVGKALDFIIADNDEGISVRVTMYIADARPTVSISLKEQEITIGGKSSPDDIVGYLSAYITAMASDPASGNSLPIPISDKNIDWCPDLVWPSAGQTLKYTVKISINDKEYAKPAYSEISVILNNTTPFYTVSYYDGLGGLLAKYRVAEGESAPTPEDPSRSHHSFNGWDTDPPSAVMSDSSHIAVWKLLPHEFSLKKAYEIYLAQPATCSSPALYYMSCECGLAGSETFSFGEKDPSLHASAEFFYTDNKDGVTHLRSRACCSSLSNAQEAHFFDTDADMICLCGYDRTHRHGTGSFVSGHAPSCVSELSGRHYYYICSCGDKFYDEDCTDPVINDTDLIIPYRHSTVYHAAVEANCCSFGSAEHFECSICQRLFADSNAFTELFDITIRPSGDHRSAKTEHDAEYHWYICEAGGTVFGKDEHIPNIPYVTEKEAKYCTVCECLLEEKLEHIHRGGQATCLSPAVCEGCGDGYGMLADHDFSSDGICIYCGKEKEGSAPIVTEEITTEAETEADTTAPQTTVPEVTENETSPDTDITEENAPTGDLCPIWMLYALIILFVAIFAFTVKKKRTR